MIENSWIQAFRNDWARCRTPWAKAKYGAFCLWMAFYVALMCFGVAGSIYVAFSVLVWLRDHTEELIAWAVIVFLLLATIPEKVWFLVGLFVVIYTAVRLATRRRS